MQSKSFIVIRVVALLVPLACSGSTSNRATGTGGNGPGNGEATANGGSSMGSGGRGGSGGSGIGGITGCGGIAGTSGDDRRFVPEGLSNTTTDARGGWLTLVGFTLVQGATGPELYAAVRNDGTAPACNPGMMTDFFDKADQLVTSAGTALQSGQFYRLDTNVIFRCVDPGQIAIAASTDLPEALVIGELGYLKHTCPGFIVDGIVPIDGLTVSEVAAVTSGAGSGYTGTLTNNFDVTVTAPKVTIFPVNRVGRPLGVATSSAPIDIPPGGRWTFETSTVDDPGVGFAAYPTASIPN